MSWKQQLDRDFRIALATFERAQRRADARWRKGTKKHPGGIVTAGRVDPEVFAMRKPFGKTPRTPQAIARRVRDRRAARARAKR